MTMEPEDQKQRIRQLDYTWVQANLPNAQTHYADFVRSIAALQEATQSADRTTTIFRHLMQQANQLGKSSDWVVRELRFEGLAEFVENRTDLLRLELEHAPTVDDDALDLYIERLNRFTTHG